MKSVTRHGPHVSWSNPSARWTVTEHWGPMIGDVREYSIGRAGDRLTIHGVKADTTLSLDVAKELAAAFAEAVAWTPPARPADSPPEPAEP